MRLRSYVIIFLLSVLVTDIYGKSDLKLRELDGDKYSWLLDQAINCIAQDNEGFLWISTYGGILRFDGEEFMLMDNDPNDPSSLSDNTVRELVPDNYRGGIWICTGDGLDYFDPLLGKFRHAKCRNHGHDAVPIKGRINDVLVLEDKVICFGSSKVYQCRIDSDNRIFEELDMGFIPLSVCKYDDSLFLAADHKGIYAIDLNTMTAGSFASFQSSEYSNSILHYSPITDRIYAGNGIGTSSAVFRYENGVIVRDTSFVPDNLMRVCDSNGKTFFGTNGNGLYLIENGVTRHLTVEDGLTSDVVTAFCHDDQDNLWIGLYRGGIMLNQKNMESFTVLDSFKMVSSIIHDDNTIYVGTDSYGLGIYDRKTGKTRLLNSRNSGLPGNNIVSMCRCGDEIWMAVYTKGLCSFNTRTEKIETYSLEAHDELYVDNNKTWVVVNDNQGRIWVGGPSLFIFSRETKKFSKVEGLGSRFISSISFKENTAYISTRNSGIFTVDMNSLNITGEYNSTSMKGFPENDVRYVYKDSHDNLWFSTQTTGLHLLNETDGHIERFDEKNGLVNNRIAVINEDDAGNLWIGTMNGLHYYSYSSRRFIHLGNEEFIPGQYLFSAGSFDGENMYFGSTEGLVIFDVDKIKLQREFSKVCFNKLTTLSETPQTFNLYSSCPSAVKLGPKDNFFRISLSVPEYIFPESIRFSCRMKGLENEWRDMGNMRTLTFTALDAGEYELEVRYSYMNESWSTPSSMEICIMPEWYASWWARTLWIILALSIILILIRIYLKQQKIKEDIRISEIEKKSIKEINEAKLDFFTRIIHDLRTPIFLITSQLEVLTENQGTVVSVPKVYLDSLLRNSRKITRLINRLIDFRKLDSGKLGPKLRTGDVVAFCSNLIADYEELCSKKNISFSMECDEQSIMLSYDHEKFESILSNLISNAFKYTKEGGFIKFTIDKTDKGVCFSVEDNGIGILPENHESIFENFSRTERGMKQGSGDGIGLAVVKSFIEQHGGYITVDSIPDVGSVFSFMIPFGLTSDNLSSAIIEDEDEILTEGENASQISVSNPTATHTILIMDDDHETADQIERCLESSYRIYKSDNAEDGYKITEKLLPDVVICDLDMNETNGHDFLVRLRKDRKMDGVKVIILTGNDSEEEMVTTLNEGADAYMIKPASLKVLKIRIEKLISQREDSSLKKDETESIKNMTKEEQMFLLKCREIIDEHLTDENFNMEFMAEKLAMSHSLLYKKIKSITGLSLIGFVNDYKIHKAVLMFRQGEINVTTVCERSGFKDEKNFRDLFKRKTGLTPKQFVLNINTKNTR